MVLTSRRNFQCGTIDCDNLTLLKFARENMVYATIIQFQFHGEASGAAPLTAAT